MGKKKKKAKGQAKGARNERQLCKDFSYWFSHGQSEDWFWRTPSSGGRATEKIKKNMNASDFAGDMMSITLEGRPLTNKCLFEFRRGYSSSGEKLSLTSVLDAPSWQKKPLLIRWWSKLRKESRSHSKEIPILIYQRDRKKPVVVVDSATWLLNFKFSRGNTPSKNIMIKYDSDTYLVCFLLEEFFLLVKPEWLSKHSETTYNKLPVRR